MLKNLLYVMLGGAFGAALRYLLSMACSRCLQDFPLGTLVVNCVGCFVLGLLMACGERFADFNGASYLMLTVGLCGAFTTFSTFSADTIRMMDGGQWWQAVLYVIVSLVLGFLLFFVARKLIV